MPPKKFYKKKSYKKKSYKKKSYKNNGLILSKSPMPTRFYTKLLYTDTYAHTTTVGSTSDCIYSCNGLYDPNITQTGHQPRGFDQIMTMYNHYTVLGAKIKMTLYTDSSLASMATISVRDDASTLSGLNDCIEYSYGVKKLVSQEKGQTILTYSVNPNKYLSVLSPIGEDSVKGSVAANPSEQAYFHTTVTAMDEASSTTVYAIVEIEYICVFTEPNQPTAS